MAKRNYQHEYQSFHGKPEQIKRRAARVKARRMLEREGRVRKGDGKDVDHIVPLRSNGSTERGNLRVQSRNANRSRNGS